MRPAQGAGFVMAHDIAPFHRFGVSNTPTSPPPRSMIFAPNSWAVVRKQPFVIYCRSFIPLICLMPPHLSYLSREKMVDIVITVPISRFKVKLD